MIRWLEEVRELFREYRRLVKAEREYRRKLALQFAKARAEARAIDDRRSGGTVTPPRQINPKYIEVRRKYY